MINKKLVIILFLIFSILPAYKIYAQSPNEEKILGKNTPDFLAKPIILAVDAIEKFRFDMGLATANTFFSFIFNNALVFYGIFLVIVILVVRFIWNSIF